MINFMLYESYLSKERQTDPRSQNYNGTPLPPQLSELIPRLDFAISPGSSISEGNRAQRKILRIQGGWLIPNPHLAKVALPVAECSGVDGVWATGPPPPLTWTLGTCLNGVNSKVQCPPGPATVSR